MTREMTGNKRWPAQKPRIALQAKLKEKYPEKEFEDEDEFFETLNEYHDHICERNKCICEDQEKLAELFISNPRVGSMVTEVINGDDPLMACIRYFGMEAMSAQGNSEMMKRVSAENDEFNSRMKRFREMEETLEKNLKKSEKAIARFKKAKEMDEEDFSFFLEKIQHMCDHVFMNDLSSDVLELFFKGINYDNDLSCTERISETRGRNERISLEKRRFSGHKSIPDLQNRQSMMNDEDNRTPGFGRKRRPSIWDL